MRKIVLLSFANTDYSDSLIRLRKETEVFPFDERVFLTEKDLKPELRKKINKALKELIDDGSVQKIINKYIKAE